MFEGVGDVGVVVFDVVVVVGDGCCLCIGGVVWVGLGDVG